MRQILFSTSIYLLLAATFLIALPEVSRSEPRVSVLKGTNLGPYNEAVSGLVTGLGFKPEIYELNGDGKAARRIAQKLSLSRPDIVVSIGTMASVVASQEINNLPVVYLLVPRPEAYLKRSGNITGISLNPSPNDQFELLQRFYPSATRIGIVFNPDNSEKEVEKIRLAAPPRYKIVQKVIKIKSEIPEALKQIRSETDILWLVMDNNLISKQTFEFIVKFSVSAKYPLLGFSRSTVKKGALLSAISDYSSMGQEGATLVKKILAGKKGVLAIPYRYPKANGY
ncbi:MAG: ABC transporter substrate-binding protein, partial [Nitrospinota bacterium]